MTTITTGADGQTLFDGMTVEDIATGMEFLSVMSDANNNKFAATAAALRHLGARVAELDGEPIATAPTDGTFILVQLPTGHVTIAQFCADKYWRRNAWDDYGCEPEWWWKLPHRAAQEPPPKGTEP